MLPAKPHATWTQWLPFWAVVIVLTGLHVTTFPIEKGQQDRVTGTRKANIELAYNLYYHGIFSLSWDEPSVRDPSAYRPPGYPAFLAASMFAVPDLDLPGLGEVVQQASHFLRPLYTIQKLLLLLCSYLAMYAVWRTTRSRWICLLPFPFICHTPLFLIDYRSVLNTYTNLFYPTPLSTFLMTALGLSLLIAFQRQRYWQFVSSGFLAGVLAVTRAAFLYYIALGALLLILWLWRRPAQRRLLAPRAACCIAVAFVVPLCWMARNNAEFGRWFIAERGGYQLNVRAQMLDMDSPTYFASFLYWSNSPLLSETLLPRLIGEDRYRELGHRFDSVNRTSYKRLAKKKWLDYKLRYKESVLADRILLRESAVAILKHPLRHLAISIPLAHRGICVEKPYLLNWLLFLALFLVAGQALRRGDVARLAMLSPALFCFLFNTAASNNLPRYNRLLIPLLWLATAIVLHEVIQFATRNRAIPGRTAPPTAPGRYCGFPGFPEKARNTGRGGEI